MHNEELHQILLVWWNWGRWDGQDISIHVQSRNLKEREHLGVHSIDGGIN